MVHQEGHLHSCRAPTRSTECPGRLGESPCEGLQRLEAQQSSVFGGTRDAKSFFDRFICSQDKCTASSLLQLASRPNSTDSRRLVDSLVRALSIHVSSVFPHSEVPEQDSQRASVSSNDCTSLAQPAVVSPTFVEFGRLSSASASCTRDCEQPRGLSPPFSSTGSSPSSRLACVRRAGSLRGLSERVVNVIQKSWRESTELAYSNAWRQWNRWCLERHTDPLSAPLSEVLEFLCEQFDSGKQYRTINTIRSAISMTHEEVDGLRVGQHPLVSRFLKGVFNSRPPAPRYSSTWDVDIVLSYLCSLPDNSDLSFQALSHKLAMLLALSNADRCSELAALNLDFRYFQSNGVLFVIPRLTKSRRNGPPLQAFYPEFTANPKLCPLQTLRSYEQRSKDLRHKDSPKNLFISVKKPHKPVKPITIGHWIKNVMKLSGIDTTLFSAHSTRGAATSKAKSVGLPVGEILKAANWSSSSTFCRFYNRPVNSGQFGRVVLQSRQSSEL